MKPVSLSFHSILSRRTLAILISLALVAFFALNAFSHHIGGIHIANLLISWGFNWVNANILAGAAVGALETGGVELLGIEVPVLLPVAAVLAYFLVANGAPWLTVY